MALQMSSHVIPPAAVVVLVVFFVAFLFTLIWVAFRYHARQEKQVRMDEDADAEGDDFFQARPGEGEDDPDAQDHEDLEPGTKRFRRA